MPKFMENFGMTFAKKWTNREPEIYGNGNESKFRQNIGHSASFPGNNKRPIGHKRTTSMLHITGPLKNMYMSNYNSR